MRLVLLLALALLAPGCGDEAPAPEATAPQEDEPASTTTQTFVTPDLGWTPKRLHELEPVAPSRSAKTPTPLASDPQIEETLGILGKIVDQYASDPLNPWAAGHGLLARGPDFQLSNGQPAVEYLFSAYAEEVDVAGHRWVTFPKSRGEQRVEPHAALMLKVFTEVGVDPKRPVTVQGQPHTVADLYRGTVAQSYLDPQKNHASFASTNDIPWALQALAAWSEPGMKWVATDGTPMNLNDFTTFSTTVLVAETQFMFQAMEAGALFEREGQGIFRYTCGGAHLLQGTAYAVARGNGSDLARKAVHGQIALTYYRLPIELGIYDEAMKAQPEHALRLLVQRLKFTGHFLESMHKLAAMGFYSPSAEQQRSLEGAAKQVVLVVKSMVARGDLDDLTALRTSDEQVYLDIVGDSAHALRGLELALGRASVTY